MPVATAAQPRAPIADELLAEIRARREEIEQGRQLPLDLVDQLKATGIFRLAVPRAFGGEEASPTEVLKVIEQVAAADGSTGWCTAIGLISGVSAGYMREAGAREVFADPSAPKSLVAEPAGAATLSSDGFRITGRWKFASGITHADWLGVGFMVMENGQPRMTDMGPDIRHAFVQARDAQIVDTWHVSGLCGTGSYDVSLSDALVPESRVFSFFDTTEHRPEPLYQMPVMSLVAPPTAIVAIGIARGALDEVARLLDSKVPAFSSIRAAERPPAQVQLARAEASLGAARAFLFETTADLYETVRAGKHCTARQRSLNRAAANQATEVAANVARIASTFGGGTAVYNTSPLQRQARDTDVITHHMTQSPYVWEDAGRMLLGQEPLAPIF